MADTTVTAAGMRIVKLLIGSPAQSVAELIRATGVTRTAVAEQLNELVAAGLVERTTQRLDGRGRPRHRYTTTRAAMLLLFATHERRLGSVIWLGIKTVCGDESAQKVLDEVSILLAEQYRNQIKADTPEERLRRMNDLLYEEGVLVEVREEADGKVTLRQRSCPFATLFDEARTACHLDEMVMSRVVGRPVRRISCRHDGDPCCVFEIVPSDEAAPVY
jgi:DeoR family transcriptional regulator, suf operon transcriptional repressor